MTNCFYMQSRSQQSKVEDAYQDYIMNEDANQHQSTEVYAIHKHVINYFISR